MRMFSAVQAIPWPVSRWASFSRRGRYPEEGPYCKAARPWVRYTSSVACRMASTGKDSGAGRPPAKEMTSFWAARARVCRTRAVSICKILFAKCMKQTSLVR